MGSFENKPRLFMRYFDMRLNFPTIPKSLKQYTLFKKDYPSCWGEAESEDQSADIECLR
jgi:hypothetical protein